MSEQLIFCPFCRCENHVWVDEVSAGHWHVKCEACQAQGPECATKQLAIDKWNRRASPWLPIETAPKDRDIFLLCPIRGAVRGAWYKNEYALKPKPYWSNDREWIFGRIATRADQPTHWMPIPKLPEPNAELPPHNRGRCAVGDEDREVTR